MFFEEAGQDTRSVSSERHERADKLSVFSRAHAASPLCAEPALNSLAMPRSFSFVIFDQPSSWFKSTIFDFRFLGGNRDLRLLGHESRLFSVPSTSGRTAAVLRSKHTPRQGRRERETP